MTRRDGLSSDQFIPGGRALERRRQFLKQRGLPADPAAEPTDEESPEKVSPTDPQKGGSPAPKRPAKRKKT